MSPTQTDTKINFNQMRSLNDMYCFERTSCNVITIPVTTMGYWLKYCDTCKQNKTKRVVITIDTYDYNQSSFNKPHMIKMVVRWTMTVE